MKKLIAIMAIAVVLVGAVFAADAGSAKISITTTVAETTPTFELKLLATNVASAATATVSDPAGEEVRALTSTSLTSLSGGTDVTVNFEIYQKTEGRLSVNGTGDHVYKFTIDATSLILQDNGSDKSNYGTNERFLVVAAKPAINALSTAAATSTDYVLAADNGGEGHDSTSVTTATVVGSAAGTGLLTVTYKGYVPANTKLGSFVVGWHGNAGAVPGDYVSTVTMTVTTE